MAKLDMDTGKVELAEDRQRFLDWLVKTPALRAEEGEPGSQTAYAAEHGLHKQTLTKWKQDPIFVRAMEQKLTELNVTPDRLQGIIDTMYAIATDSGHKNVVQAATLYLQYVEKLKPTKVIVESQTKADGLSDEQLAEELLAEIHQLRAVGDSQA